MHSEDPWAVSTQKPVPGTTIHHHSFLASTSRSVVCENRYRKSRSTSRPAVSLHDLKTARGTTWPTKIAIESKWHPMGPAFSFSFQQQKAAPADCLPRVFRHAAMAQSQSNLQSLIPSPETLCSFLGARLDMEETRKQLLSAFVPWSNFHHIESFHSRCGCSLLRITKSELRQQKCFDSTTFGSTTLMTVARRKTRKGQGRVKWLLVANAQQD